MASSRQCGDERSRLLTGSDQPRPPRAGGVRRGRSTPPPGERARIRIDPGPAARRGPSAFFITAVIGVGALLVLGVLAVSGNLPGAAVRSDPDASTAALPLGLVRPAREAPAELADGRSLGAADAPIVIESWSDFQCAVCGRFAIEMEPRLIDEYVRAGKVRIVARDLAFLGIRAGDSTWDESIRSAAAARCAGRQDRFWQFHDWLFANQGSAENSGAYSQKRLEAIAKAMGLEMQDYQLCMAGGDEDRAVIEETASGQAKGLASAPSFYFNGEGPLAGLPAWASLKEFLDLQLGAGPSPVPSATPAPSASPPS